MAVLLYITCKYISDLASDILFLLWNWYLFLFGITSFKLIKSLKKIRCYIVNYIGREMILPHDEIELDFIRLKISEPLKISYNFVALFVTNFILQV